MTTPWVPASSVGWVDLDRDEAERVKELLGLFKAPEAIDPHGILPLQIALSDRLFPGMSTQHTRARYVFFTAWHAQQLAAVPAHAIVPGRLRRDELALMKSLMHGADTDGIFGKFKQERTQTLPAGVYWSALQAWEIVPRDLTLADVQQYQAFAHAWHDAIQRADDDRNVRLRSGPVRAGFPKAPGGFPDDGQTIGLTQEEADYLRDRVAGAAASRDSLLPKVFANPDLAVGKYPWTVNPEPGGAVQQALDDARRFSELIHPARLLYTRQLVDMARRQKHPPDLDGVEARVRRDFERWWEEVQPELVQMATWAEKRLPKLLNDGTIRLSKPRRDFIADAIRITLERPEVSLASDELGTAVGAVERAVKRQHARLREGEPFRRWMNDPTMIASQRLDYRWGNVQHFAKDIGAASKVAM